MKRSLFIQRPVCVLQLALLLTGLCSPALALDKQEAKQSLQIAPFQCDVTPPVGSPLCYGFVKPVERVVDPLSARGLILLTDDKPIVLCVIDWVAISNGAQDAWIAALADAVGTTTDRVSVHVVHQHDAPGVDFTAEEILAAHGHRGIIFSDAFARDAIRRTATAAGDAVENPLRVSHIGYGLARVEKFASNRRIIGDNGKIKVWRGSSAGAEAQAEPEGTIDPNVRLISFWDEKTPLVSVTYYASHPQSYYGRGGVSADTIGLARTAREKALPQVAHLHFNGAGGNIVAGKYNNGAAKNREILAERLAVGMTAAWKATKKTPVTAADVNWTTRAVKLPLKKILDKRQFTDVLADPKSSKLDLIRVSRRLAWMNRHKAGHKITIGCLQVGPTRILHMPGELFIESSLLHRRCVTICLSAWRPIVITVRATSAPGSRIRRVDMKSAQCRTPRPKLKAC